VYSIELSRTAAKELERVFRSDRVLYQRFIAALDTIARDPGQGKLLHGKLQGLRSYRMGTYRILYETYHQQLLVIVIDLGHRKEIYR
jgi:mRNA interferase RelE/StbE